MVHTAGLAACTIMVRKGGRQQMIDSRAFVRGRARPVTVAVALLALGSIPMQAISEDAPDPLNDPFLISLGTYLVDTDTTIRLDGTTQDSGTRVDWDRTFDDATATQFRVDAMWRFAERHKLRALWFSTSRSKSQTIDEEIEWEGETFPVNTRVKGDINWDIYELSYEYSFLRRDTYELSASIGAYYAAFDSSLSATITNPGGTTQRNARGDASVDLPLPVLGLRGLWALPYDLSLDVSGQWFSASIGEYSGNLQNYRATLTWQPKTWLGIGLGYDWFQAHGDVDASNYKGDLDWTFQGPMIYYSFSF
jgi:hypothetical protein